MILDDLITAIAESRKIALLTHISPDGDAIGSTLAMMHALLHLGKDVDIYSHDTIPDTYDFMIGSNKFKREYIQHQWYDLAIVLDCSDLERLGSISKVLQFSNKKINIDHHVTNTYFADINHVVVKAAATSELVFDLIKKLKVPISATIAESLYVGIITDTGNFSFSNVTANTLQTAAVLLSAGANPEKLVTLMYKNHSLNKMKLWGEAINSLEIDFDGKFASICLPKDKFVENGAKEFDVEGIVNLALDIKGIELAILIREVEGGFVKVSFRSKTDLDVSKLSAKFGGGGHRKAAGCLMKGSIDYAKSSIKEAVQPMLCELMQ